MGRIQTEQNLMTQDGLHTLHFPVLPWCSASRTMISGNVFGRVYTICEPARHARQTCEAWTKHGRQTCDAWNTKIPIQLFGNSRSYRDLMAGGGGMGLRYDWKDLNLEPPDYKYCEVTLKHTTSFNTTCVLLVQKHWGKLKQSVKRTRSESCSWVCFAWHWSLKSPLNSEASVSAEKQGKDIQISDWHTLFPLDIPDNWQICNLLHVTEQTEFSFHIWRTCKSAEFHKLLLAISLVQTTLIEQAKNDSNCTCVFSLLLMEPRATNYNRECSISSIIKNDSKFDMRWLLNVWQHRNSHYSSSCPLIISLKEKGWNLYPIPW